MMSRYKVEISGINTGDLISLSNSEMIKLFKLFQNGNLEARELLVNGNLKLVLSVLKKFYFKCDNLDDLFQIGCVGLIKAIDNFDLSYNVKFSTYAVPMILGEIKRYIRDNNSIRISSNNDNSINNVLLGCTTASNRSDSTAPALNSIRSKGLNIFSINVPFLALAGTKYPFTMYHTPFY